MKKASIYALKFRLLILFSGENELKNIIKVRGAKLLAQIYFRCC